MLNQKQVKQTVKEFIEHTIPKTVRDFSLPPPRGLENISRYYLEYFVDNAEQRFKISGLATKYAITTRVKENYEAAKNSEAIRAGRYNDWSLAILPPIEVTRNDATRARVKARLKIGGKRQSNVVYDLRWCESENRWRIVSTTEADVKPHHLAWNGVIKQMLVRPSADSLHLVQRLLFFKSKFEADNTRRALLLKGQLRKRPEAIPHTQLQTYLWGVLAWNDVSTESTVTSGRTDLQVRCGNAYWVIEVKVDKSSARGLAKALLNTGRLDRATWKQMSKYHQLALPSHS